MGKPADDDVADYGKNEQPPAAEGQTADANANEGKTEADGNGGN
jgi:hypothetical protein